MQIELSQLELDMIESILCVKKSKKEFTGKNQDILRALHRKFQPFATTLPLGFINASEADKNSWSKEFNDYQMRLHAGSNTVATLTKKA